MGFTGEVNMGGIVGARGLRGYGLIEKRLSVAAGGFGGGARETAELSKRFAKIQVEISTQQRQYALMGTPRSKCKIAACKDLSSSLRAMSPFENLVEKKDIFEVQGKLRLLELALGMEEKEDHIRGAVERGGKKSSDVSRSGLDDILQALDPDNIPDLNPKLTDRIAQVEAKLIREHARFVRDSLAIEYGQAIRIAILLLKTLKGEGQNEPLTNDLIEGRLALLEDAFEIRKEALR